MLSYIFVCLRNMPDVEDLMQEWPPQFEDALKEVSAYQHNDCVFMLSCLQLGLPTADLDCDLTQYTDIICGMCVHLICIMHHACTLWHI